jgi:hypothetical protein
MSGQPDERSDGEQPPVAASSRDIDPVIDPVHVLVAGTAAWAIALIVTLTTGHHGAAQTATAGLLLGIAGIAYTVRRRRRIRAGHAPAGR